MASFTMSWTSKQWKITRAYLPRKTQNGYTWQRFDSAKRQGEWDWDYNNSSAAGIHPWTSISTNNYFRAVNGFHYWYNTNTRKVERRSRMVQNTCDILNWGVNNW